jgi:DNA-binding MarR family transcriptional regulator
VELAVGLFGFHTTQREQAPSWSQRKRKNDIIAPFCDQNTLPALTGPTHEKWGAAALAGFQTVPDLLLRHQKTLKISSAEMVVLLNVLMHWWYRDQMPYPRPTTIARRMGTTVRTVQRALLKLQELGLLEKVENNNGGTSLDPTPLVRRLCELAQTDSNYLLKKQGGAVA